MPTTPNTARLGLLTGCVATATIISSAVVGSGPEQPLRLLGAAFGLLAIPFAVLPYRIMLKHGKPTPGQNYMATTELVERGPFRLVRHPQYLSYIFLMFTFALLAQQLFVTLLALVAIALIYFSAIVEEKSCIKKLGEPYRDYLQRVPRFNLLLGLFRWVRQSPNLK